MNECVTHAENGVTHVEHVTQAEPNVTQNESARAEIGEDALRWSSTVAHTIRQHEIVAYIVEPGTVTQDEIVQQVPLEEVLGRGMRKK